MKFNDNVLVKQAIFGLYGDEVKNQAKFWIVRNLISGNEIPVPLNDCFDAYDDFDEVLRMSLSRLQIGRPYGIC